MEMQKASRKQVKGVQDNSNLSESVRASKASAAMFDTLTNSFLQITDVAATSAINAEIRESTLEGEMEGVEGSAKNEDGSFKGYDNKYEIFKWDVASNKASKKSFESNVTARANSSMKTLSKAVDGDMAAYKTVAGKQLDDSLNGVDDKQQRQHITNSYAKSYNTYMATVAGRGYKKEGAKHKASWDDSREAFVDDNATVQALLYAARGEYKTAQDNSDGKGLYDAQEKINRYTKQIAEMNAIRREKGAGGILYGTLSVDGVARDTDSDMFEGYKAATVAQFRKKTKYKDKMKIRENIARDVNNNMSPVRVADMLKALDEEMAHENAMASAEYSKKERDLTENKRTANTNTRATIIDMWDRQEQGEIDELDFEYEQQEAAKTIDMYFAAGWLTQPEMVKYKEMLKSGDTEEYDDPEVYAEVFSNIEEYGLEEIATMQGLKFQSRKELIKRWEDTNENEQWMKSPAYKEGKGTIKQAFGFSATGLLPEKLSSKDKKRRQEMIAMIDAYQTQVREKVAAGEVANHYEIASGLVDTARNNIYSSIINTEGLMTGKQKTAKQIQADATRKGVSFQQALSDFESMGGEQKYLSPAPKPKKEKK